MSAAAPEKLEDCVEFKALAVPNVLGGGLLGFFIVRYLASCEMSVALNWVLGAALVVLLGYFNIGEAKEGLVVEEKKRQAAAAAADAAAASAAAEEAPALEVPKCKCAFLGLGEMGRGMAANLAKREEISLSVWNRTASVAKEHEAAHGASAADTVAEATADCDFVFTCLPTTAVVEEVARSVPSPAEGKRVFFVDSTSGEPEASRELAKALAERGITYVDAPVSGGPMGAKAGTLAVMLGADDKAHVEAIMPLMRIMGANIVHVGPVGAGHSVKALNNAMTCAQSLLTAEVLVSLARRGVDPGAAAQVIAASSGTNKLVQFHYPKFVLRRDFSFGFALKLLIKDVNIAAGLVDDALRDDSIVLQGVRLAREAGERYGDVDFTMLARLAEEKAGIELRAADA